MLALISLAGGSDRANASQFDFHVISIGTFSDLCLSFPSITLSYHTQHVGEIGCYNTTGFMICLLSELTYFGMTTPNCVGSLISIIIMTLLRISLQQAVF